jgi:Polyprenyl synthetase
MFQPLCAPPAAIGMCVLAARHAEPKCAPPQAYFLVADDIMDKSITRRGRPCWYRAPAVGMVAINDGILLEQLLYFILRTHLRGHPAYTPLLELFLETTHQTAHGQLLDLITAPVGTVDLSKYTRDRRVHPILPSVPSVSRRLSRRKSRCFGSYPGGFAYAVRITGC